MYQAKDPIESFFQKIENKNTKKKGMDGKTMKQIKESGVSEYVRAYTNHNIKKTIYNKRKVA